MLTQSIPINHHTNHHTLSRGDDRSSAYSAIAGRLLIGRSTGRIGVSCSRIRHPPYDFCHGGIADLIVRLAIPMLGLHMLHLRSLVAEEAIAIPAVMVIGTLPVMLFTRLGAPKVEVAIIARPVRVGILLVLLQSPVVWEPSFTAITIRHRLVVVRRKEGDVNFESDLRIYINCMTMIGARLRITVQCTLRL